MLKRRALMESISSNLHGFLKTIGNNLSVPDKKFLRDSLIGLLRCGKPVVCQMARQMPDRDRGMRMMGCCIAEADIKRNM